jgi:uncharacterized protein (TIGR01777 family)
MKKHMLIAGGTGLIGSALTAAALTEGWDVTVLSRTPGNGTIMWDPENNTIAISESMSFDAIINLAGTSIAGSRWTEKRKKEIVDSRVNACRTIEKYLIDGTLKTQVYLGASAIGIYGNRGNEPLDETSAIGNEDDWMVRTVKDWEAGHARIAALDIRTVVFRIGIVLSRKGGALPELLKTSTIGILGYFGSGREIWPWIHIDDLVRVMMLGIEQEKMSGTYLAVAPDPVSNKQLTMEASKHFSPRRIVLPVPVFVLRIMLGEMHRMLMQSCNAQPKRFKQEKFQFRFQTIKEALTNLIAQKGNGKA